MKTPAWLPFILSLTLYAVATSRPRTFAESQGPAHGYDEASYASVHHLRLTTARGVVHSWTPPGYVPQTAGIVIYLHGYYTSADQAWDENYLASQFLASRRNALFLVPEAPTTIDDEVQWKSLEGLLTAVERLV